MSYKDDGYTTIRIKKSIKALIEKLFSGKVGSSIETLALDKLLDKKVVLSNAITGNIDIEKLEIEYKFNLNALEVIYFYWKKLTPYSYQTELSLKDFIDIDNLITIDIYARIYTNVLNNTSLRNDEINNLNSLEYLRKVIFSHIDLNEYKNILNEIMNKYDPYKFGYISNNEYSRILTEVMTNPKLQSLVKNEESFMNIKKLKDFFTELERFIKISDRRNSYLYSNFNLPLTKSFKNMIMYSSLNNYTTQQINSHDISIISQQLHTYALEANIHLNPTPFYVLQKISLVLLEDYKEIIYKEKNGSFITYLSGNLGAVANTIEEKTKVWIDYYESLDIKLEGRSRIEFMTRTSSQIIEFIVNEKRLNVLENNKISEIINIHFKDLIAPFISIFNSEPGYWIKKDDLNNLYGFSKKYEFKDFRITFDSNDTKFDRATLKYGVCSINIKSIEFINVLKQIQFIIKQNNQPYKNKIALDTWQSIETANMNIKINRLTENNIELIKSIIIKFTDVTLNLEAAYLDDFIEISKLITSDKDFETLLNETRKIEGEA